VWKTYLPPGFDSRAVQPIARRYTDYDIPAHATVPTLSRYQLVPTTNDPTSPRNLDLHDRMTQRNRFGGLKSRMLYDWLLKRTSMLAFAILVLYSVYLLMTYIGQNTSDTLAGSANEAPHSVSSGGPTKVCAQQQQKGPRLR